MRSSKRTEVSLKSSAQQRTGDNIGTDLTTAWKSLAQSKAALRHIENHLEAVPGTGVLLDSVMYPPKEKSSRMVCRKDGQQADNERSAKRRGRSQWSPEKSSSRSPLRNTTQDSNVCRINTVEFREPLTSYREATPPLHPSSQQGSQSLQSVPGSSYSSPDPLLSQLVYQRDTRDKQTDRDLNSTHSSALESTAVRYLNDLPPLGTLKTTGNRSPLGAEEDSTYKAQLGMDSQDSGPCPPPAQGIVTRGESTPSSSPGSASQRLENLRRHQPDDKLEKLKERIRRQRQHLEEAAERERLMGFQEWPIMAGVETNNSGTSNIPTAKIRKVAPAPPAPNYRGFNSTETKIRTPDGKVWKEEEFHNLSREIYRDLSQQFAEITRSRDQQQGEQRVDRSKERRPPKPVRKVHKAAAVSDLNTKPVINPASWRDGQKLVKMVLGPVPKLPREEEKSHPPDSHSKTASHHRSRSDHRSKSNRRSRPNSTERSRSGFREQSKGHFPTTSTHLTAAQDKAPGGASTDLLSADIQGILDDLQLDHKVVEKEERARQRSHDGSSGRRGRGGSGSRTRTPMSAWGPSVTTASSSRGHRSASPTARQSEPTNMPDVGHKKRTYDADSIRQYITRQQEERKRRQADEKRSVREETERRNQRLQELYRKQREVARTVAIPSEAPVAPVQKRLQETYNKLLLEEAQLGEEATQTPCSTHFSQMRPVYQPSGESDKENKRLDAPQSPSSSDQSFNEQLPPLSRNDLDVGVDSVLRPDHLSPAFRPTTTPNSHMLAPVGDHLLSQLLKLEQAVAAENFRRAQRPAPSNQSHSKISRIEALKATAASLSSRIESEARKIAGEGINYGTTTSVDIDTVLAPRPPRGNFDDGCWEDTTAIENNEGASSIQRIFTSTGHSSYNSATLPGVSNLHTLRGQKERKSTHISVTHPQTTYGEVTGPILNSYIQERGKLDNGLEKVDPMDKMIQSRGYDKIENQTDLHDSSAGSISEGPILSEGSFSEDETSPPHPSRNHISKPADGLEGVGYYAGQRRDYQRLSEFQKEAARCSPLGAPYAQHDSSNTAWEELNKGSPLSVINIFTKNLHGPDKVSGRNSPLAQSSHSGNAHGDAASYEDDFTSPQSSRSTSQLRRGSKSPSVNSHFEELMRRSPYEKSTGGINSHHSSFHSSVHSPHLSSGSASGSLPLSQHSFRKRGTTSDQSDGTLVEEQRSPCSPSSEILSSDSRERSSDKGSAHSKPKRVHSSDSLGEPSGHSHSQSFGHDGKKSSVITPKHASPLDSPVTGSPPGTDSPSEPVKCASDHMNTGTTAFGDRKERRTTGELQYSPAVLQQRMAAELQYLESVEESVRQLDDMERYISVSMAQQESASLAQMLKAKQQHHERDLYELKIKAEQEALEAKLQLEENRQRMAMAHIELQGSLASTQKETLEGLQEATTKMMSQQAEAARYTADTARHIKEMTELARSQIAEALVVAPVAKNSSTLNQQDKRESPYTEEADSFQNEVSSRRTRSDEPSLNSLSHSDSLSFRRPNLSEVNSSSHKSSSNASSNHRPRAKKEPGEGIKRKGATEGKTVREADSSSIEEDIPTAANDSLCSDSITSVVDEKGDTTSVATEYSLKFDESMTEDEIEERSFRSLLPSEAHRRGTIEKKSHHREGSEYDGSSYNAPLIIGAHNILKPLDANMSFSGGQDSFSQFTMDMVRQYMKDEEVRLQHQSSLLHLRQKAVKEKTRTELAWLEHHKKRLRDKGEDDKMPPIRKKQRGLLMKLQQEQAEIKRLQEANKAARKERQLLLKQQEEIERMRNSTLRLKERLKSVGGEPPPETPVSETPMSEPVSPNIKHADDNRSPSPSLSISGSETSSIMQKLKKMRTHMDEKHCSPVHYFLSVFNAHHWASLSVCLPNLHPKFQLFIYNQLVRFLTKREQQLMQRRRHAEELLLWKQRLDQEEAEVRRMEKEALAAWDRRTPQDKDRDMPQSQKNEIPDLSPNLHQRSEPKNDSEKVLEYASEYDSSSVTTESSIHTEESGSRQPGSISLLKPVSVPETPLASVKSSPANYSQDFTSPSPSRQSLVLKEGSPATSPSDGCSRIKIQLHSSSRTPVQARIQPTDSPMASQTEPISDQSDIECRITALKEELRKRKVMAHQLKKEQKKRHKERLKAKEASLLKQLETCNDFIEKTQAELNKGPDTTPDPNFQTQDSKLGTDQSGLELLDHRSEKSPISEHEWTNIDASSDQNLHFEVDHGRAISVPELSDEDPPTVTPAPVYGSPECPTSVQRSRQSTVEPLRPSSKEHKTTKSGEDNSRSDQTSEIHEELERDINSGLEEHHSECLLTLEKEARSDSQENRSTSSESDTRLVSPSEAEDVSKLTTKSLSTQVDHKTKTHPSYDSVSSVSRFPDSDAISSKKEAFIKDAEASSAMAGDNQGNLKSPLKSAGDSIPREPHHSSKAESVTPTGIDGSREDSTSRAMPYDSQDEDLDEEIAEDLSHHSVTSEPSHESGRLLDLQKPTEDFKHDPNSIISIHSPPMSPLQTSLSPIMDGMPSFNIGDRVLVGSVQPGTLRFKGSTSFANGFWAGVELDKSEGSNNGTYDGVVYFECDECHGIFAPPDKISRLPENFEVYADTTEDEDSFFDGLSDKVEDKCKTDEDKINQILQSENEQTNRFGFGDNNMSVDYPHKNPPSGLKAASHLHLQHDEESKHQISNGNSQDIILDFDKAPTTVVISDVDEIDQGKQSQKPITMLVEREDVDLKHQYIPSDNTDIGDLKVKEKDTDVLDAYTDELFNNVVKDTVKLFAEIKRDKEQRIRADNQKNRERFCAHVEEEEEEERIAFVEQKDGLPFFSPVEKEELSSPELCNRPESPVLGASGQEELAKKLAELELSRELLDDLGDDQDWFDEDFGLSSHKQQQRLKQRAEEEELRLGGLGTSVSSLGAHMGGLVSSPSGEVKSPPRPELPLPMPPKLPELPAMVVPHSAAEVEKMVHAATQEIWESCGLGKEGPGTLAGILKPKPSQEYLGKESSSQDQEDQSICSYKKGVYDLTWEMLQEIYAEDPHAYQPQWVKTRRVNSSFHRVKTPGDIAKLQAFIASEVLKLYGLTKDESQKTDWQKMLKFGRKKRDKVDQILVQELHEEEAQWVNYDEDELFVKMQLADSIFDALLKDTANVLTLICDKRAKRDALS